MHTQYSPNPTVSSNLNQSKENQLILDRLNVHTDAMVTVSDRTERKVLTKVLVLAATRKSLSLLPVSSFENCEMNIQDLFPSPVPNTDMGREQ